MWHVRKGRFSVVREKETTHYRMKQKVAWDFE